MSAANLRRVKVGSKLAGWMKTIGLLQDELENDVGRLKSGGLTNSAPKLSRKKHFIIIFAFFKKKAYLQLT